MSADRELLELAAKAAGLWDAANNCIDIPWDPLADDGDALRLAVKLRLDIDLDQGMQCVYGPGIAIELSEGGDPYAATRRSIVRAAAEIGRAA